MIKTFIGRGVGTLSIAVSVIALGGAIAYAATNLTAVQTTANRTNVSDQTAVFATTTANASAGVNDQTFSLSTTTANVAQVKASRTLSVNSVPGNNTSNTIGSCLIFYSTSTATSYDCSSNNASINTSVASTSASFNAALASLVNVGSSNGHGPLAVSSTTSTTVTFSTAGTEASSTSIFFADGTSNAITSIASTSGTVPVAQINQVTVGGTAEAGDVYSVTLPTGLLNYTTVASDTTATNIALDLKTAIQATSTYSSQPFTVNASSTALTFTAKTAGTGFTVSTSATNRAAAAQVSTLSIGGTPEAGDIFAVTLPSGVINYTTTASDTASTTIASNLNAAIQASSTYSTQPFTTAANVSNIVITAKTPGTGFIVSASTTNGGSVAQVVQFTVPTLSSSVTYTVVINGTSYSYTSAAQSAVAPGLASAMAGDAAVNCTASGNVLTCTSKTPGTAFTYSTSAVDYVAPTTPALATFSGGGGGGSSGSTIAHPTTTTTVPTQTTITTTTTVPVVSAPAHIGGASQITASAKYRSSNSSIKALQTLLASDPALNYTGGVTGYFGVKTLAAVKAFQTIYGVAVPSDTGYGLVGPKTRAALIQVYGI